MVESGPLPNTILSRAVAREIVRAQEACEIARHVIETAVRARIRAEQLRTTVRSHRWNR
jgi:hypothetical protein